EAGGVGGERHSCHNTQGAQDSVGTSGCGVLPGAGGRALTQPTLPFLVYLRERIGKTVDDRAIADPFCATRAVTARPCRIERADGPGPSVGEAPNLPSGTLFNALTSNTRSPTAAGPPRNTCSEGGASKPTRSVFPLRRVGARRLPVGPSRSSRSSAFGGRVLRRSTCTTRFPFAT